MKIIMPGDTVTFQYPGTDYVYVGSVLGIKKYLDGYTSYIISGYSIEVSERMLIKSD